MYKKEKDEKSNNVGVTIDITEVAEIHCHGENSSLHLRFLTCLHVFILVITCNSIMESVQIIILIDKTQLW